MTTGWYPNIMQQTMIRAQTKLEFAYGLGTRMAEAINDNSPATAQMLGEIWTYAEFARAAVHSAETDAFEYGNGVWFPNGGPLDRAARGAAHLVPAGRRDPRPWSVRTICSRHRRQTRFRGPGLRDLIDRYLRGAKETTAEIGPGSSGSRGTSSAAHSPGGTCSTSASTSPRARATIRSRTFSLKDRANRLLDQLLGLVARSIDGDGVAGSVENLPGQTTNFTRTSKF